MNNYQASASALLSNLLNDTKVHVEKSIKNEIEDMAVIQRITGHIYRIKAVRDLLNSANDHALDDFIKEVEEQLNLILVQKFRTKKKFPQKMLVVDDDSMMRNHIKIMALRVFAWIVHKAAMPGANRSMPMVSTISR